MDELQDLNTILEKIINQWTDEIVPKLKSQLDKKKIFNSGELETSLRAKFAQESSTLSSKILITYALQGKFQDLKRWNFTTQPPVEELTKWVLQKGLSKFPYIPAYQNSNRSPNTERAARRIAWGIARSWERKGKVTRRNQWRPLSTVFNTLPALREEIATNLAEYGLKSIVELLKKL